jgi:hypothetical protein
MHQIEREEEEEEEINKKFVQFSFIFNHLDVHKHLYILFFCSRQIDFDDVLLIFVPIDFQFLIDNT